VLVDSLAGSALSASHTAETTVQYVAASEPANWQLAPSPANARAMVNCTEPARE
jgi:hypothetical protein